MTTTQFESFGVPWEESHGYVQAVKRGDHDIDANVPGFGRLQLKSSVVKKSS